MRFPSSFFDPFTRPVVYQIDQLCDTLHRLGRGLRESVVRAVGQAVADAVREALRSVLGAPVLRGPDPGYPSGSRPSLWGNDDLGRDEWYHDDEPPLHDEAYARHETRSTEPAPPSRPWYAAWAAGLHAAAWSLQRCGRYCIPMAIGTGLLATVATYAGGPLFAVAASVIGSLACLLTFDSDGHAGADALAVRTDR